MIFDANISPNPINEEENVLNENVLEGGFDDNTDNDSSNGSGVLKDESLDKELRHDDLDDEKLLEEGGGEEDLLEEDAEDMDYDSFDDKDEL